MAHSDDGKNITNDNDQFEGEDDEEEYELNQEQIIETILLLGNEIWKNFGGEPQPLDDVRIFFQHSFYIKCFEMAYPDFDFTGLLDEEDEEDEAKMAEAIQALVDLLGQEILLQDMSHIRGDEIVNGNPEHCINLLQILQQISMMQDDSESKANEKSPGSATKEPKREGSSPGKSSPGKKGHSDMSDEKDKQNEHLIMGLDGDDEDYDDSASPDKQQFLDNLQDDEDNEGNPRVGDVIGNIGEELDIEFDNDIQNNLQNNRKGEVEIEDELEMEDELELEDDDLEDHQVIDHNDVQIIDDGADFQEDPSDGYDEEEAERQLNRQTDNMAEYEREQELEGQLEDEDEGDMDPAGYGEEIDGQNSSRFQIDNQDEDEEGLNQLHDQLKILDNGEGEERLGKYHGQLDDGNLQMEINSEDQDEEDEGQHYPDEEEDEDMLQLEEMEAQMQQQQLMNMQNQEFDDIDPEVLEAAQKMGLDDEGMRALQQQLQQQQQFQGEDDDEFQGEDDEEGDLDEQNLQEMLNRQEEDEDHVVSTEGGQIVRGGRNITDVDNEDMDSQMAQQLKQLNEEDNDAGGEDLGEDQDDDDDNQLIDIDKLNDEEKAILIQYLQSEYQKNPDNLPLPKEVIEQFLEDNRELVQNLQEMQQDEDDENEDDGEQDNNLDQDQYDEVQHDHQMQQDGQMVIQEDHQHELDDDEADQTEPQFQGEEEENDGQNNQAPAGADYEEEYGEEDNQEQQIINPQYQLEDMVVRDQDGNLIQHNLNVNTQNAQLNEQQQYQMMLLAQQQMAQQQQQQMMIQQQHSQKVTKISKKKRGSMAHKKPPLAGGALMAGAAAGMMGASKKGRKPYMKNINTISHDEENNNPNVLGFNMVSTENHFARKNHSQKRPQTAKTRKPFGALGAAGKPKSRVNNFMVSSTPSHKMKGSKQMGNTHGLVVPQSQMFTSFGAPANKASITSQRKTIKKKTNVPASQSSISNISKKKLRGSIPGIPKPKSKTKASNQPNFQIAPNQNQVALQQQMLMQQQMLQNQINNGGLVDMPILSEEFLNQLNEDQLLALLAQQQQLMMLRQQQQMPGEGADQQQPPTNLEELPEGSNEQGTEEENEENANMMDGQLDMNQQQMQAVDMQQQQPQTAMDQQEMAHQQALMMQYQQQLQQQPVVEEQSMVGQKAQSLRNRGRAKAYTQSGRQVGSANRIPGMAAGSASRSHGSRKRGQKTRSSLNVKSSLPLNSAGYLGPVPQSLSVLPSSVNVKGSKKAAAQIYGNASVLQNLTSQRKKSNSTSQTKKSTKGKRSQPNQGGKFNKLQQQIQAQNLQYNMLNDQQLQTNMLLQQQQMQLQAQQEPQPQNFIVQGDPVNQNGEQQDEAQNNLDNEDQEGRSEAVINEASPEQEDGESNTQQFQNQVMQDDQNEQEASNIQAPTNQISNIAEDLSTEQIIELLQNAQNQQNLAEEGQQLVDEEGNPVQPLPEEVYVQLQQVLQERMIQQQQQQQFLLQQQQMANVQGLPQAQQEKYDGFDICNILTESVSKAKQDLAHLAPGAQNLSGKKSQSGSPVRNSAAFALAEQKGFKADERIQKQKKQFANLLKEYKFEQKVAQQKRVKSAQIQMRGQRRDERIKAIKQRKFEEEMVNQQRSQMFKRNAQQVRLCKKVYRLASDLEKNKLLDEKKQFKENEIKKLDQKHKMVETIENYYKDKIAMLKEKIHSEKFERHVAEEAQKKALSQMKKELDQQKNQELQRYVNLLHQEDEKFNIQGVHLGKLEKEIIKMYKKK